MIKYFQVLLLLNLILLTVKSNEIAEKEEEEEEPKSVATCLFTENGRKSLIHLLDNPDDDDPGKIDFTKRHRVDACGREYDYLVQDGKPVNPANASKPGRGSFPYWGPNVLTQQAILKSDGLKSYYLATDTQRKMFQQNVAASKEKGFKTKEMKEVLEMAVEAAVATMTKKGMGEKEARARLLEELESSSKMVLSGTVPRRSDAAHAWMEIQQKVIVCQRKTLLCKYGIEAIVGENGIRWIAVKRDSKKSEPSDTPEPTTGLEAKVKMEHLSQYSGLCDLENDKEALESIKQGTLTYGDIVDKIWDLVDPKTTDEDIYTPVGKHNSCFEGCQRELDLLDTPDGDDASKVDFTKRHRIQACGQEKHFLVHSGMPLNPANVSQPGKGPYPYWGPNILSQQAFLKEHGRKIYFLAVAANESVFQQNLASDADKGFNSRKMRKFVDLSIDSAVAALVKQGMDKDTAEAQIREEFKNSTKTVLAGNLPRPTETKHAWLEIQSRIIMCRKGYTLCKYGIEKVAERYTLRWVTVKSKSTNFDISQSTKIPNTLEAKVTMEDIDKYSAFCELVKYESAMEKIKRGTMTVAKAIWKGTKNTVFFVLSLEVSTIMMIYDSIRAIMNFVFGILRCFLMFA